MAKRKRPPPFDEAYIPIDIDQDYIPPGTVLSFANGMVGCVTSDQRLCLVSPQGRHLTTCRLMYSAATGTVLWVETPDEGRAM